MPGYLIPSRNIGGIMKRNFEIKEEIREEAPELWLDEALDEDGVDLEEWAFWQGYYKEEVEI